MAVIKFVNAKYNTAKSMGNAIDYILDKEKTTEQLITGIGVDKNRAYEQMMPVKKLLGKTEGRQCVQFIVSFDDDITPEKTHEICNEIAGYYANDYQVLIATHQNTAHPHSHFILNSVNITTGQKYRQNPKELEQFKAFANEIFQQHGVTPINAKGMNLKNGEYWAKAKSFKAKMRRDIKAVLKHATSKTEFIMIMNEKGYSVKWEDSRKYVTFTDNDGHKCRDQKMGLSKADFEQIFEANVQSRKFDFCDEIKKILPSAPDIIPMPTDTIPPDLSHLTPEEQKRALAEFYNTLHFKQVQAAAHNEREIERVQNERAICALLDLLEQTVQQLCKESEELDMDDGWNMEL